MRDGSGPPEGPHGMVWELVVQSWAEAEARALEEGFGWQERCFSCDSGGASRFLGVQSFLIDKELI